MRRNAAMMRRVTSSGVADDKLLRMAVLLGIE
jgi:hypothetical protein